MRRALIGLVAVAVSGLASCGGPAATEVSGVVTWEGQPLPEGQITFLPDGGGQGGSGPISNGRYSVRAPNGKNKVQITASKLVKLPAGQTGMNGAKEEVRQYIPERYNTQTKLAADVGNGKEFPFDLTAK